MPPLLPELVLMSVHVPKCGGSSLGVSLSRVFQNQLLHDSGDRPGDPAAPMNLDPDGFFARYHAELSHRLQGKRAVHGHFHARKYAPLKVGFRTAIIREPIARLISHYYYWLHMPREGHLLHNYFLDQQMDLAAFAQLPFIRHLYSKVYFGGMNLEDFDYIGSLESLPEAFRKISHGIGLPLEVVLTNKGEGVEYQEAINRVQSDKTFRARLSDTLCDDIRFYEAVRNRWA